MLTKLVAILLITLPLFSCREGNKKSVEQTVHPGDKICLKEISKAKKDLLNDKLVFCNYVGNIIWQPLRAEKEIDSLLKLHNIGYEDESSPCIIQENRNYHCYCEYMQEQINLKYGDKFTDSLLSLADSLFILKNLDKTYDNGSTANSWDKPPVFPGDSSYDQTNHSGLQKEFDKVVNYPKNYRYKKGENSMAMLQFYLDIDQNGKAKITNTKYILWNDKTKEENYNKEYYAYFRNIAASLIENTKWTPAKIKSISVKSKNDIFVYLK
jgi:hypothetical protein